MSAIAPLLQSAATEEYAGRWRAALGLYERAFRAAQSARDAAALTTCVLFAGNCWRELDELELALEHFELGLLLARLQGEPEAMARALNGFALVQQRRGEVDAAEQTYQLARELARQAASATLLGTIEQNLGTLATLKNELDRALECFHASLQRFEQAGYARGSAWALTNLGGIHLDRRELEQAAACFERALQLSLGIADTRTTAVVHLNRAELFLAAGEQARAQAACAEAFELCCRLGSELATGEALRIYGAIVRGLGQTGLAEVQVRQAIAIAVRRQAPLLEAEAQRDLAALLRTQGRNREAMAAFNRALAIFARLRAEGEREVIDRQIAAIVGEFLEMVERWGESIEAKDAYTRGHCQRVAGYAGRLADELLDGWELVWFRMGAFLHDIGKTGVADEILNKPGPLTPAERAAMQQHAALGDAMLAGIEFPWDVRCVVRSHHERWDGRGYPDGLAGPGIPLPARILCLADVFDALTTTRSYHSARSPEEALHIMRTDARAYDPQLFPSFQRLLPDLLASAIAQPLKG